MADQLPEGIPAPSEAVLQRDAELSRDPRRRRSYGGMTPSDKAIEAARNGYWDVVNHDGDNEHAEWYEALRAAYAVDFPGRAPVGEPPPPSTDWKKVAELRRQTEIAIVRTEEAVKRLRAALGEPPAPDALRKYAQHLVGCRFYEPDEEDYPGCSCGFLAAIERARVPSGRDQPHE